MCSLNEDDVDVLAETSENKNCSGNNKEHISSESDGRIKALCKKCQSDKPSVVLRIRDAYCRDCFLAGATHKFRATIGKSKLVSPRDRVLISYSADPSSAAMLHMIEAGLRENVHKRFLFTPCVIFVDESSILGLVDDTRSSNIAVVKELLKDCSIPCYLTSIEFCVCKDDNIQLYCLLKEQDENFINNRSALTERLRNLFSSVTSLTAKEDLLIRLRRQLLIRVGQQLKCSRVFVHDTSVDTAVSLLSGLAMGRGADIPLETGFCDSRNQDVLLLRPMREFSSKEIAFYNVFHGVHSHMFPTLSTKVDFHSSIQRLTGEFINGLQSEFQTTVPNLSKTGDKLGTVSQPDDEVECCPICQGTLNRMVLQSSARQATMFSDTISKMGPQNVTEDNGKFKFESVSGIHRNLKAICVSESSESCECSLSGGEGCGQKRSLTKDDILEILCYGCRLIVKDMCSIEHLPDSVLIAANQRRMRQHMKNEIQDFLL